MVSQLEYISRMKKKFDKSLEIDARKRATIVRKIKHEWESGEDAEALAHEFEAFAHEFEALYKERPGCDKPSKR